MTPRVSVCIPAYNAELFLGQTLASVWAQSFEDFEVVVVDDASTDGTAELLRGTADPRLRYWSNSDNAGQGRSTDEALAHARGEFIKFLDADDVLDPNCLGKMVRGLDAHPSASFVFCRRDILIEEAKPEVAEAWLKLHADPHTYFSELSEINSGPGLLEAWIRSGMDENWISEPAGVMARRSALERVGGYSTRVRLSVDMELWARLMTAGDVVFLDEKLYTYRFAITGVTGDALKDEGNWLDGLWSAEGLLALRPQPLVPLLRSRRRQLLRKAVRVAASDLRSRPVATFKSKDLAAYASFRLKAAVGRADTIFTLTPAVTSD